MDEELEMFEDAVDTLDTTNKMQGISESALRHCKLAFQHFLNNEQEEAIQMCTTKFDSPTHFICATIFKSLKAVLTLDKQDIQEALKTSKLALKLANKRRSKDRGTFFTSPDFDSYTDEECVAEFYYATALFLYALLTVLDDRSFSGFVRGGVSIRSCHQIYKKCSKILSTRMDWDQEALQVHFEAGTRLALGLFNVAISVFPPKLTKVLELIGFSGNRVIGLQEIEKAYELKDAITGYIASIFLVFQNGFLESFYGVADINFEQFEEIVASLSKETPNGDFYYYARALLYQAKGEPLEAVNWLDTRADNSKNPFKHMVNIVYTYCYCMLLDWENATKYAKCLTDGCRWSPAMFRFYYACFMAMSLEDRPTDDNLRETVKLAFKDAQSKKQSFGGRKVFHEKIVLERSRYYCSGGDIVFPALEQLYMWNRFRMMSHNPDLFEPFLALINKKLTVYTKSYSIDNYSYLTFMKGVCLTCYGYPYHGIEAFLEVIDCEKQVEREKHLAPQACFEIGLIQRDMGNSEEMLQWFKKAKSYDNYYTKTMIDYRVNYVLETYNG